MPRSRTVLKLKEGATSARTDGRREEKRRTTADGVNALDRRAVNSAVGEASSALLKVGLEKRGTVSDANEDHEKDGAVPRCRCTRIRDGIQGEGKRCETRGRLHAWRAARCGECERCQRGRWWPRK